MDRIAPLARARVPLLHLHGDCDEIVPIEQNTALLAERYRQLGGPIEVILFPGQGHNYWSGWFRCQRLVDFVIAHARCDRAAALQKFLRVEGESV